METEEIYGSTMVELENRIHELLDDPRVLFRDMRYTEEDGECVATVLYDYKEEAK